MPHYSTLQESGRYNDYVFSSHISSIHRPSSPQYIHHFHRYKQSHFVTSSPHLVSARKIRNEILQQAGEESRRLDLMFVHICGQQMNHTKPPSADQGAKMHRH